LTVSERGPENQPVSLQEAASVQRLKKGDMVLTESCQTDSFLMVVEGAIRVTSELNGQPGWTELFGKGSCISPLPPAPGLVYSAEAAADGAIIEITPSILKKLPDRLQLSLYKDAMASATKVNVQSRLFNAELASKNLRLSQYILNQTAARNAAVQSEFVQGFLKTVKRLPTYATDLAMKLLDDTTSVQEVVEGIRSDPALVAVVLRTVNSAQYGLGKKVESFYHACMILGFNNIYNLLMREAAQSTMPVTRETTRIHKHSCLISVLCFEIAPMITEQQSQTASTIGLLHDLGKGVRVVMKSAHPAKADFVDTLEPAKLGAALLRTWGIPERMCKIVEFQQHPEFMPPDLISPEYRRETAALHIAHVLEMLLMDKPLDPSRSIYTADYMGLLGFGNLTPAELLRQRVLPSLTKNRNRIPPEIHSLITKPAILNS
jgi:HD-like signal output (HDOD) protein